MTLNSLAATISAGVSSTVTKEEELSTLTDVLSQTFGVTFSLGVVANKADSLFHDERTLTDAQSEILNFLAAGSLKDKLGEVIDWDILKALVIKNTSTEAGLIIGATGAGQMAIFGANTESLVLPPGGVFIFTCPDLNGVDISTNASMKLTHDGTGTADLIYKLVAIGIQS